MATTMPPVPPIPVVPPPPPPPAPNTPATGGTGGGNPAGSGVLQWILRISVVIALAFAVSSFFDEGSSGGGGMIRGSHAKFFGFFLFFSIGIVVYRLIPKFGRQWPHIAVIAGLLGTTIFNWLWWSTHSGTWEAWRNSERFWPMTIAIIFTAILSGQANPVAKLARYMLIGLVLGSIFLGVSSYAMETYCWAIPKENTTLRKEKSCTEKPGASASTPTSAAGTPSGVPTNWDWTSINGPEKDTVMAAFPNDTVMWKIAAAESDYSQFRVDSNGDSSIVQNKDGVDAYGIFQIRKSVWDSWCKERGFDIMKTHGNIGCAKAIKAKYPAGNPWLASAHLWRDSTTVDPCMRYAQYGGDSGLEVVRKDTVITPGDTLYTRRIPTENLYSDWYSVNFRTDYMVRYAYRDPARGYQIFVAEEVMEKERCPEENRLPRHPLWVEFRSLDADPIMIEVTLSQKR